MRFLAKNGLYSVSHIPSSSFFLGLVSCSRCLAVRSSIALPIEISQQQRRSLSSSSRSTVGTAIPTSSARVGAHQRRRHHGQSECESCQETAESINSNHGRLMRPLPVTVQRSAFWHYVRVMIPYFKCELLFFMTHSECDLYGSFSALDDAEASERSLLAYMLSYRLVRWMRTLMLPWLLPMEFTYLTCRRFVSIHIITNINYFQCNALDTNSQRSAMAGRSVHTDC